MHKVYAAQLMKVNKEEKSADHPRNLGNSAPNSQQCNSGCFLIVAAS